MGAQDPNEPEHEVPEREVPEYDEPEHDEPDPGEWTAPPRDVPPPRPVTGPGRRPPPHGADLVPLPGGSTAGEGGARDRVDHDADADDDEPAWLRERREEAEFAREFGDWRGGMSGGRSGGRSGGVRVAPLLVLLAGVVLVLWLVV